MKMKYKLLPMMSLLAVTTTCTFQTACSTSSNIWIDLSKEQIQSFRMPASPSELTDGLSLLSANLKYFRCVANNFNILKQDFLVHVYHMFLNLSLKASTYINVSDVYWSLSRDDKTLNYATYEIGFQVKGIYNSYDVDVTINGKANKIISSVNYMNTSNDIYGDTNWYLKAMDGTDKDLLSDSKVTGSIVGRINNTYVNESFETSKSKWWPDIQTPSEAAWKLIMLPVNMKLYSMHHIKYLLPQPPKLNKSFCERKVW